MHPGILYATLAYIAWGLFPLYFQLFKAVSPVEIIAHRTLWSLVFLAGVLVWRRQLAWLRPLLRQPRVLGVFALSALLLAGNWLVYVWAVTNGQVLESSLGYFMLPLVSVALGTVFLHERPRPGQWLAVAIAAAGVAWLTWQTGHLPWAALALALTFGFYGLLRKTAPLGALEGLSLETALLLPLALAYLAWTGKTGHAAWTHAGPGLLASLLAVGPNTAVPLLLFAAGARRIPLATLGLLQYISPMLQFVLGVWLLGETASPARLVGFGLIWAALLCYTAEGLWQQRVAKSASKENMPLAP